MNLAHLYYFKKLVEDQSYSKAAKDLYIAQPTLSLAISALEKELGVTLIKKKRNQIELTRDGEEFYEAVVVSTNVLDNVVKVINERASQEYCAITIGTVYSIQGEAWSKAIGEYRKGLKSQAAINWKQGTTESLSHDLKNGTVDVIFSGILSDQDPSIESVPCFTQSAALLVNRQHPFSSRDEISLDELDGARLISYRDKEGPFVSELGNLLQGRESLKVKCEYTDEITLCSLVVADPELMAISCHSRFVNAFPDVKPLVITEAPKDFHRFYLRYVKKQSRSHLLDGFIKFMRDYEFTNITPRADEPSEPTDTPLMSLNQ